MTRVKENVQTRQSEHSIVRWIVLCCGLFLTGLLGGWGILSYQRCRIPDWLPQTWRCNLHNASEKARKAYEQLQQATNGVANSSQSGSLTLPDADRDGLPDSREQQYFGTDPTLFDTDGDGVGDGEERLLRGTDPTKADQ